MSPLRSARTILCVPGHQDEMVARAATRSADRLCFDLEDSVPEGGKDRARAAVAKAATLRDLVRINAVGSAHYTQDRVALDHVQVGFVAVPKVSPGDVRRAQDDFGCRVIAVIESAAAVHHLDSILRDEPAALIFGYADFMADCRLVDAASPLIRHARIEVVLGAASVNIPAFDSPCTVDCARALHTAAAESRSLGFAGMICIHPRQIAAVNAAFTLSTEQQRYGRAVLEQSAARGGEVFELDGNMVAAPMVKLWERVLG